MIIIRITLNDARKFFINETRTGIILVNDITNAFYYQTTLEFKVTWKLNNIMKEPSYYYRDSNFKKENVSKFEFVDTSTLDVKEFDVKENEIEIGEEIYVDEETFRKLMKCGITSSHWLYDKDDNWLSFPKESDYDNVTKIRYYKRGLMATMTSHNNWNSRYDKHSWHRSYESHHKLMLNPIIQQICLLNLDSCHGFTIYEKKVN
jgi:hypothetical protein